MKKVCKVEIEVGLEELDEQTAISLAHGHHRELGGAEEPIDEHSNECRRIPAEEFVSGPLGAIMEIVTANVPSRRLEAASGVACNTRFLSEGFWASF